MSKLTDSQSVILSNAAKHEDGTILPLPKSLKFNKGAVSLVLESLIKKGLIEERPATPEAEAWREDDDSQRMLLVITHEGLKAIGVEPDDKSRHPDAGAKPKLKKPSVESVQRSGKTNGAAQKVDDASIRPGTKQAMLIDLLKHKRGASIAEISEATGWQAHSVRGAISGALKKKLGLDVSSEKVESRGRVYRIVGQA